MSSLSRHIEVEAERQAIKNIQKTYGKKPKTKCPKCKKKSLFFTNNKSEMFCVRCDQKIN